MEQESPNVLQESNLVQQSPNIEQDIVKYEYSMKQQSPDALENLPSKDVESSCSSFKVVIEPEQETQVSCRECHAFVKGYRNTCVSCDGCVVCASCALRGVHPTCYVLRVPPQRPLWEVQAVLRAMRGSLTMIPFADGLAEPLADYRIAEIKSESEDDSDRVFDGSDQKKLQEDEVFVEAEITDPLWNEETDPLAELLYTLRFKPSVNISRELSVDSQSRVQPAFVAQTTDDARPQTCDVETQTDPISHPEALEADEAQTHVNKSGSEAGQSLESNKLNDSVSEPTNSQCVMPSNIDVSYLPTHELTSAAAPKGNQETTTAVQPRLRTSSEPESTSNSSTVLSIDNQSRDDPSFAVQTSDNHILQTCDVETHTDPISHPEALCSDKAVVEADCNESGKDAGHTNISDFIVPNKRVRRLRSALKSDKVKDDVSQQMRSKIPLKRRRLSVLDPTEFRAYQFSSASAGKQGAPPVVSEHTKSQISLKRRRLSVLDPTELRAYQFSSAAAGKQEAPPVVQARLRTRSKRKSTSNRLPMSSIDNQFCDETFVVQTSKNHMLQASDVETHAEAQTDPISLPEASGSDKAFVEADCNKSKSSAGISKIRTADKIHTVHIANLGVPQKRVLRLRSAPSSKSDKVQNDVPQQMESQKRTNKRSHKRTSATGEKQEAPPVVTAKLQTRSKRKSTSNRLPVPSIDNQFHDDTSVVVQTSDDHMLQTLDVETHAKAQTDPISHPEASGANKAVVEADCNKSKSSAGISKIRTTDKIHTVHIANLGVPQKRVLRLRSASSSKSDKVQNDVPEQMESQKRTNKPSHKRTLATGEKQEAPPVVTAKLQTRSKRKSTSNRLPVRSIDNQFHDDTSVVVQTSDDHMSQTLDVETHAKAQTDPISHPEASGANKAVVEADCNKSKSSAGISKIRTTDKIHTVHIANLGVPQKRVLRLRSAPSSKSDKVQNDVPEQMESQKRTNKRSHKRTSATGEKQEAPPVVKAKLQTRSKRKSTSNWNKKALSKLKASSNNNPVQSNVSADSCYDSHATQPLEETIESVTSRVLRKFERKDTSKNKHVSRDLRYNNEQNTPKVKIVKLEYNANF